MKFNRKIFFDLFRQWRGGLTQQQVNGLNFLLGCIEQDRFVQRIDWAAYMLATAMHETAYTFMPIHEYGGKAYFIRRYGGHTAKGRELGNDTPEEGYDYAGKGDVQLTGESNYEKAEVALRREYPALVADFERRTGKVFDLTVGDQPNDKEDPKNAQDPQIAYAIMSYGMRTAMFTRYKLSDFLNNNRKDYKGSRKIINGTDKDDEIAALAVRFENILKDSQAFKNLRDDEINLEIPTSSAAVSALSPSGNRSSIPSVASVLESATNAQTANLPPPSETSGEPDRNALSEQLQAGQNTAEIKTPAPETLDTTETATVEKLDSTTTQVTTARNEQSVNEPAIVTAPEPQGIAAKLKAGVGALFGGTLVYSAAERFGGMTLSTQTIILFSIVAIIALVGFCFWAWIDAWKQNKKVAYEVESKTAIDRKDIVWM